MPLPPNYQTMPSGLLLQTFRETMQAIGSSGATGGPLVAAADAQEEEISRRMAW